MSYLNPIGLLRQKPTIDSRPENPRLTELASKTSIAQSEGRMVARQNYSPLRTVKVGLGVVLAGILCGKAINMAYNYGFNKSTFKTTQGEYLDHFVAPIEIIPATLDEELYWLKPVKIKEGDNLQSIVSKTEGKKLFDETTMSGLLMAILKINGIKNPEQIQAGRVMYIPVRRKLPQNEPKQN